MVVRYLLRCSACQSITLLRMGVSYRDSEAFQFDCQECQNTVSGKLLLDQRAVEIIGLSDVLGANELDPALEGEAKFVQMYHPDFLTDTKHNSSLGPSPFISAFSRYGKDVSIRFRTANDFIASCRENSNDVQRLTKNFFSENWESYQRGMREYFPDHRLDLPIDKQWALFQLLELAMALIFSSQRHADLIKSMHLQFIDLSRKNHAAFLAYIDEALKSNIASNSRSELVEITTRFMEQAEAFRSVLPDWNSSEIAPQVPTGLAVLAPKNFHEIKALYVDAYEAIARSLTLLTGFANTSIRGHHDRYVHHPRLGKRYFPKSLLEFHGMKSAPKIDYLHELPWIEPWISSALDPKLRNAIGHYSAKYNPSTGNIHYEFKAGNRKTVSYGEFLFCLIRIIRASHQMSHFTKMIYVHHYLRDKTPPK